MSFIQILDNILSYIDLNRTELLLIGIIIFYLFYHVHRNIHITGPISHNLLPITQSLSIYNGATI